MIEISMTEILIPSPHPSPQWGEGKDGGRFGYLKLEIGICLGFGICNLGFHTLCPMLSALYVFMGSIKFYPSEGEGIGDETEEESQDQ
jgi:hypothetical protein